MTYTAYHQVGAVDHALISYKYSRLWVSLCGLFAYLDFIIIFKKAFFVVAKIGFHIWQYKREVSVSVSVVANRSPYGGGGYHIKLSVPSYEKINILFLSYQLM